MDLLKLIKEKASAFSTTGHFVGIESVINHIEIAERHLNQGKKGDDYLFNDVVYRTNQAFEGSLKEAYNIISGNKIDNKTPNEIEKYLESNNLLKERVLGLFSNYRKEWRNKSTHDYKLYFSEQEAFLAIVSISAFFNILLDQMLEKIAYEKEKEKMENIPLGVSENYLNLGFVRQVLELLSNFSKDLKNKEKDIVQHKFFEREVVGMLSAYLNVADPKIEVYTEHSISLGSSRQRMIADFVLQKGDQKLIIELKMPGMHVQRRRRDGREQLLSYMAAANIENGILFIPTVSKNQELMVDSTTREFKNIKQTVLEIYPK